MLEQIISRHEKHIINLAESWLAGGAACFGLWVNGSPWFQLPENCCQGSSAELPFLAHSVPIGVRDSLEIRIFGLETPVAEARLRAEAEIIAQIVQLSNNLDGLTSELIDTQDQLLAIYNLTQATRNYIDIEKLLKQLAYETADLVKADSAFVIYDVPGEPYFIEHFPQQMLDSVAIERALQNVKQTGQIFLSSEELITKTLVNFLMIPIQIRGRTSAALGLTRQKGDFMSPDLKLAQALADHSGAQIENVLLYKRTIDQMKLQTEMELARQVQLNLLPRNPPRISGLDLWALSRPALRVGGDFFDFHQKSNHPLSFTVGDISGKGLPAALLMSMTRTVIRSKVNESTLPTPGDVVSLANEELYADFTDVSMFATVFVGQYDQKYRQLTYANAGHSPVIYRPANGKATLLEADGTALGVLPTSFSEDHQIEFRPGDVLLVGTDGLNETQNEKEEMFGYDRMLAIVNQVSDQPAQEIGNALYRAVNIFGEGQPQSDDQTLLVIKGT